MRIGTHDLDQRTLIVAEIGVNHEGNFDKARELLAAAAAAGADAVKFQAYYVGDLRFVSPSADPDRFARMQRNELSYAQFRVLAEDARQAGVLFLCTCFDPETVAALDSVLPAFKIASGDVTNDLLLESVARTSKPVLLSTGMATPDEIRHALDVIASAAHTRELHDRVVLLQCTSSYPCPPEQVQLGAMKYLRDTFHTRVGYSDHTLDILACQAAVALGACVLEKHFTDRKTDRTFRDHALSAEPDEFRRLVQTIREVELLSGGEVKAIQPSEAANREPMRRSIGVRRDVSAGTTLTDDLFVALRPSIGWPASDWAALRGRKLLRSLQAGDVIRPADLSEDGA